MDSGRSSTGVLFILPYLIFLIVFFFYPVGFAFYLVFHRWDLVTPPEFVGLRNFYFLIHDPEFGQALRNTLYFLVIHIPLQIVGSLVIATVLAKPIRARTFFRAAFFLPVVISGIVVTILWQKLYATDTGFINHLLNSLGLPSVNWLTSPDIAMPSIAIMSTWKNIGLYIILFLAGILAIPTHLYEAARLEGCGPWNEFRHITLPLLRPSMVVVVVLSTMGGFNLFIEPYVMTNGGPLGSTLSVVLYMYKQAFSFQHMGYAATVGFSLAFIILIFVALQRKFLEKESYF